MGVPASSPFLASWAACGLPLCLQVSQASWGPTPDRLTLALDDGSMRIASIHKLDRDVHRLQAHMGYTNVFAYSHNYK